MPSGWRPTSRTPTVMATANSPSSSARRRQTAVRALSRASSCSSPGSAADSASLTRLTLGAAVTAPQGFVVSRGTHAYHHGGRLHVVTLAGGLPAFGLHSRQLPERQASLPAARGRPLRPRGRRSLPGGQA